MLKIHKTYTTYVETQQKYCDLLLLHPDLLFSTFYFCRLVPLWVS